jgi:hypothetical protein
MDVDYAMPIMKGGDSPVTPEIASHSFDSRRDDLATLNKPTSGEFRPLVALG